MYVLKFQGSRYTCFSWNIGPPVITELYLIQCHDNAAKATKINDTVIISGGATCNNSTSSIIHLGNSNQNYGYSQQKNKVTLASLLVLPANQDLHVSQKYEKP